VWVEGVTPPFLKRGQFAGLCLKFCEQDATFRVGADQVWESCAVGSPHGAPDKVRGWVKYPPAIHAKDVHYLVLEQAF
jgi:hypothetical protein